MSNDALNQEICDRHNILLLQAEVNFAVMDVLGLEAAGTVCYHGFVPTVPQLAELLRMKVEGFKLTEERFNNHIKIMAAHGLVHNTEEGQKLGEALLAKGYDPSAQPKQEPEQGKFHPHNRLEDN